MNNEKIVPFMNLDLAVLSLLAVLSETLSSGLLEIWNSGFYFSFSTAICLIAMIRWGAWGILTGMAGGIPAMAFSNMTVFGGCLYYVFANIFLAVPILLFGRRNRNQIAGHGLFLLAYVFLSHLCLAAGKGIAIFLITGETTGAVDYFGAAFLILFIDMFVCLVLKTRKGLICDMRYYFTGGEGNEEYGG